MASPETQAEGIKLLEVPKTVNDEILMLSTDRKPGATGAFIDISNSADGKLLIYTRTGKGLNTKYSGFVLEGRDPLLQSWLDDVPEFDEVIVIPTYDEIKEAYFGPEETEAPAEQEMPAPRRERRTRRVVDTPVAEVLDDIEEDLTDDADLTKTIERLKAKLAKRTADKE